MNVKARVGCNDQRFVIGINLSASEKPATVVFRVFSNWECCDQFFCKDIANLNSVETIIATRIAQAVSLQANNVVF